jgi:hypothetical protein
MRKDITKIRDRNEIEKRRKISGTFEKISKIDKLLAK